MIKIGKKEYYLKGVTKEFFWKELDSITAGQETNPEFSYTTQHYAKFENVFAGRKTDNNFSIYLYRPIAHIFRTEILSKGIISENSNGIKVNCRFEIPFWSLLFFFTIGFVFFGTIYLTSVIGGIIINLFGIALYLAVIDSNYKNIKREMSRQLELIETKAKENNKNSS